MISGPTPLLTSYLRSRDQNYKRSNLFVFCNEGLSGYTLQVQPHLEICQKLDGAISFLREPQAGQYVPVILVPRGGYKTSIGAVGLPIKILEEFPDIRILLTSHKTTTSIERLRDIKWKLIKDERFRETFGDWSTGAPLWNDNAITINRRVKALREASITVSGAEASVTGGHYEVIIADDIQNETNYETENSRQKIRMYFQTLFPLLEPGGIIVVLGTRWHPNDLYGWMEEKNQEAIRSNIAPDYDILRRGAYLESGEPWFPSKLGHQALEGLRRRMDQKLFACNYLNTPIEEGTQVFHPAYLRVFKGEFSLSGGQATLVLYDQNNIVLDWVPIFVTLALDPAFAGGPKNDFNGITVVGTSPQNDHYILEAIKIQDNPDGILNRLQYLCRKYRPHILSWEVVGAQMLYKPLLIRSFRDANVPLPQLYEYKDSTRKTKAVRINALEPIYRAGKLWVREGQYDLLRELKDYPELDHEDLLDSLSQHLRIARPASEAGESIPELDDEQDFMVGVPKRAIQGPQDILRSHGAWTGV